MGIKDSIIYWITNDTVIIMKVEAMKIYSIFNHTILKATIEIEKKSRKEI